MPLLLSGAGLHAVTLMALCCYVGTIVLTVPVREPVGCALDDVSQDLNAKRSPRRPPQAERRLWYQYYLHGDRGRAGLNAYRREFARLLWQEWSPDWAFTDDEFDATATSFDNPDFVDVVVHSYRHRYGLIPGDPAYQELEDTITAQPPVPVPTVVIDPLRDGLVPVVPPAPPTKRISPHCSTYEWCTRAQRAPGSPGCIHRCHPARTPKQLTLTQNGIRGGAKGARPAAG